ncbi:MAG: protein translocase subunit SecD [Gammaproteobacteria bacterium]|nr:protein translocase subunit SecD [Gammaproteobacteria bacterium]
MNRYALWKYLLIVVVIVVGVVFALPNLYGEDPAVQISPARAGQIDEGLQAQVSAALETAGIKPLSIQRDLRRLLIRFPDTESQLQGRDVVSQAMGGYVVALNLAPVTPGWLSSLGARPMYLGLDLRGGVHFLMEVDMQAAVHQAEERYISDIRPLLRESKIRYKTITRGDTGGIRIRFRDAETRTKAARVINDAFQDLEVAEADSLGNFDLRVQLTEQFKNDTRKFALQQNITTLRNRVNELGVAEPVVQQQGKDRVVVQLPGVQDTARAKEILGATATLEFRLVDTEHSVQEAVDGRVPVAAKLYYDRDGQPILLKKRVMLTGEYIIDAASGIDQLSGSPAVFITLDGKGARIFSRATRDNVGKPMAVVFIERKTETVRRDDELIKVKELIEEVINVATIREQLSKRFQITGLDSTEEARDLALLLRAGALAAPLEIIEERTVGPSLGQDNIEQGFKSVIIGFVLVLIFMAFYYRLFGLVADLALTLNLVLIVALLSMLQATLTLPGIAGIVLTVGMAVDANVLIFERIREELRSGNSPQASIHAGYEKAFATIADANITTLIAAVVLFGFGTGPIKGFAVTLSLGIICSMFTAIMGTRAVINLIYGGRRVEKLAI